MTLVIPTDAPAVAGPAQGAWTRAHWEALPDDGCRYEIIDGVLYMSTAPSSFHQWIAQNLYELVGIPAKRAGTAFPFLAPISVFLPNADPVQPDFVLVLAGRKAIINERHIHGVPDLIAEVLSPGSKRYDEGVKLAAYAKAGVPEYAVIDPEARELRLYRLETPGEYTDPLIYSAARDVTFHCLPTISLCVGDLFAGAPDTTV